MSSVPKGQRFYEGHSYRDLYTWRHICMAYYLQVDFLAKFPNCLGFNDTFAGFHGGESRNRAFVFVAVHTLETEFINKNQPGATIYANLPWYMRNPYHWILLDKDPFFNGSPNYRYDIFTNFPQSHANFLREHPLGTALPEHLKRLNLFQQPTNDQTHPVPKEITDCVCGSRFEFECPARYHRLDDDILIRQMAICTGRAARDVVWNNYDKQYRGAKKKYLKLFHDDSEFAKAVVAHLSARMQNIGRDRSRFDDEVRSMSQEYDLLKNIIEQNTDSGQLTAMFEIEEGVQKPVAYRGNRFIHKTKLGSAIGLGVDKDHLVKGELENLKVFSHFAKVSMSDGYMPPRNRGFPDNLGAIMKEANSCGTFNTSFHTSNIKEANGGPYTDSDYTGVICRRHYVPDF